MFRWVDEPQTPPGGLVAASAADTELTKPAVVAPEAAPIPVPDSGNGRTWLTPDVAAAGPAPIVHHLGGGGALVARPPEVADGLGLNETRVSPLDPDGYAVVTQSSRGLQEMVQPAATGPATAAGPGTAHCWRCVRETLPGQRFCRCGAMLVTWEPATGRARPLRAGTTQDVRGFRASIRAAAGGRPRFDRPLSSGVVLIRAVCLLAVILLAFSQLTPVGVSARDWVVDRVAEYLPGTEQSTVPGDR
jgi:hypothetical protein